MIGKDRGKRGKLLKLFPEDKKAIIEGLNLFKKHVKPRRQGEKGQIVQVPRPIALANLRLICDSCGVPRRFGHKQEGDKKLRVCKKCGSVI